MAIRSGSHHRQRHRNHKHGDEASDSDNGRRAVLMNPNDRLLVVRQVHGKCSTALTSSDRMNQAVETIGRKSLAAPLSHFGIVLKH
jgi:hypothetical protein